MLLFTVAQMAAQIDTESQKQERSAIKIRKLKKSSRNTKLEDWKKVGVI